MEEITYYIDQNGNYYVDAYNDNYISRIINNVNQDDITFKKQKLYMFINGVPVRMKPAIRNNNQFSNYRTYINMKIAAGFITSEGDYFNTADGLVFITND